MNILFVLVAAMMILLSDVVWADQEIIAFRLDAPAEIDGNPGEWTEKTAHRISLKKTYPHASSSVEEVEVHFGYHDDTLYVYATWQDKTEGVVHKPYKWNEEMKRYREMKVYEDRFILQFGTSGDYSANWAEANDFECDMWHVKMSRSIPLGIAHDKHCYLSGQKLVRASVINSPDGKTKRYIRRKSDSGDALYKSIRHARKVDEVMPKYKLADKKPQGSIADITAIALWSEGRWHLELKRALVTGNDDDVVFAPAGNYPFGVAVFDNSPNYDHSVSDTLRLTFRH